MLPLLQSERLLPQTLQMSFSGEPCLPQFHADVSSILKLKTRIPEVGVLAALLQPILISKPGGFNLFRIHTTLS